MTNRTVQKNLAGQEDLLFGEEVVQQTRGTGNYPVSGIRGFYPCNTLDERNALDTARFPKAVVVINDIATFYHYHTDVWNELKTATASQVDVDNTLSSGATDVQTALEALDTEQLLQDGRLDDAELILQSTPRVFVDEAAMIPEDLAALTRAELYLGIRYAIETTVGVNGIALTNDRYANPIRKTFFVDNYGAKGDGVTNDTTAFTTAFSAAAVVGGIVEISSEKRYIVDSFTIPKNVSLKGNFVYSDPRTSAELNNVTSTLLLTSGAGEGITLSENSSLQELNIFPSGMTFPQEPAGLAAWIGTAVKVGANAHGCYLGKLTIVGFNTAIDSDDATNTEQIRCYDINFDCVNGILINNVFDIAKINNCHGWPVATINAASPTLTRLGTSYKFANGGDWNKITDSFSFGYNRGLTVDDCNDVTISGVGFDNTSDPDATIGIEILGTSNKTIISNAQCAGHFIGVYVNTDAGLNTKISGASQWGNDSHSILIDSGDVEVNNNTSRDADRGITVNSATSLVTIGGASTFSSHTTADIDNLAANKSITISSDNLYLDSVDGTSPVSNIDLPDLASAATVNLPANSHFFNVTGTTNIDNLAGGWAGREIILSFSTVLVVGNTGNIEMDAVINTTAKTTIKLVHTGTVWRQI